MMKSMATGLASLALLAAPAWSKLPEPGPEAKAKAAETAARNAYNDKVSGYQLCQVQDRIAAQYLAGRKGAANSPVKPVAATMPAAAASAASAPIAVAGVPVATPPCTSPGTFVYTPPPPAPPIEAAGAHSPAATAAAPPSSTTPQSEQPKKK